MGKTNIQYADEVSNPLQVVDTVTGKKGTHCEKPDPNGTCKQCWAEMLNMKGKPDNNRFGTGLAYSALNRDRVDWVKNEKEMARLERLNARSPKSEKFPDHPLIVFTNDTYDLFQPSISDDLRDWIFDSYEQFNNLTLLVQTTYVSRMKYYLRNRYENRWMPNQFVIGMSAGTQKFYDLNIDNLRSIPSRRVYVIFEPLLEEIDPGSLQNIDLIIIGGESGPNARSCDIVWIRKLKRRAQNAGTSVLVKQLGTRPIDSTHKDIWGPTGGHHYTRPVGDPIIEQALSTPGYTVADEDLRRCQIKDRKGGDPLEWPEDLRIREFPEVLNAK